MTTPRGWLFDSRWTPIIWGLLAFVLGIVPHLCFESTCDSLLHLQALQAIWDGSFRISYQGTPVHVFSAHVWPIGLVLAPLVALFPGYATLIALQSAALASTIPAMRRLLALRPLSETTRRILLLAWMFHPLLWAIHLENRESYQLPTFAIALFLWGQWAWETRKTALFLALGVTLLLLREDVALTVAFWGLFLALKDRTRPVAGILLSLLALAWFLFALKVAVPHFTDKAYSLSGWGYEWAGNTPAEVVRHIIVHPIASALHMFSSTRLLAAGLWIACTLGGFLVSPLWLLPALPQLGIDFLSDTPRIHLPLFRYSAPILPFLWLATLDVMARHPRCWITPARLLPLTAPLLVLGLWSRWIPDVKPATIATLHCLERNLPRHAELSMTSFRGISRLWSPGRIVSMLDDSSAGDSTIPLSPWVLQDRARQPSPIFGASGHAPLEARLRLSRAHRLMWNRDGMVLWGPANAQVPCPP